MHQLKERIQGTNMPNFQGTDTTQRACNAQESYAHQHKMWDLRAMAVVKNEELFKHNLQPLYAVMMSLCDTTMEDKVTRHKDYVEIKNTQNTLKLLQVIKQLLYLNVSEELNTVDKQLWLKSTSLGCDKREGNYHRISKSNLPKWGRYVISYVYVSVRQSKVQGQY